MEKVLIVDDSRLQAAQLKSILKEEYDITIAQTAEDGLYLASIGNFSLILLDVVMLITSLTDEENEQRGLMLGAVDYITKPFRPLIVKARVDTHIKLYNYRKQVEYQSRTDQLTGIANRWQHDRYSIIKWKEAMRLQQPFSICMFDIDRFKAFNDTFGHPAGDKVIVSVAKIIDSHLQRSTDFLARYGGEEFVAFLLGDSSEKAFAHLKKIRQAVEDRHIPHAPSVAEWVTISIGGMTVIPQTGDTYQAALKIADNMLYEAKSSGRNRVVWMDEKKGQLCEK